MTPDDSDDKRHAEISQDVPVPAEFLSELLPQMTDVCEIQVCLAFFRLTDVKDHLFAPVVEERFLTDRPLKQALRSRGSIQEPSHHIRKGLDMAVSRGVLLSRFAGASEPTTRWYFYDNPAAQLFIAELEQGRVALPAEMAQVRTSVEIQRDPTSVFRQYEQHVGAMTPLIADRLVQALTLYPEQWISDAISNAARSNRRSWRYIETILVTWQASGKSQKQAEEHFHETHRRNDQQPLDTGEYGDGRYLRRARRISMPDL